MSEPFHYEGTDDVELLQQIYPRCTHWLQLRIVWKEIDSQLRQQRYVSTDKWFCGVGEEMLHANIKTYCGKNGITNMYTFKEKEDGIESQESGTEQTPQSTEEKE